MTIQEAIKFLQQLYPVGGHCWLDEQRIEAIGMAIKALQEESVNRTPADIKAAKGNTDKCKGCNNVKGCLTCVDGDQWAHIEEARTELVKEGNETPFITLCKEDESGVSLQFCICGRLVSDYRITKPNARFLNHSLDAYLAKYDTDKYEFEKELGNCETKYNLRGIVTGKPSPAIKKIVDSLTPEIMDEAKKELEQEPVSEDLEDIEKSAPIAYVVTRCEEHSDYVEKVFFDEDKAQKYCDQFKRNENEYVRHITKVEVTL